MNTKNKIRGIIFARCSNKVHDAKKKGGNEWRFVRITNICTGVQLHLP